MTWAGKPWILIPGKSTAQGDECAIRMTPFMHQNLFTAFSPGSIHWGDMAILVISSQQSQKLLQEVVKNVSELWEKQFFLFNNNLLTVYYVPGTVLGTESRSGNKSHKNSCPGGGVCVWKLTVSNKHTKVSKYKKSLSKGDMHYEEKRLKEG